MKPGITGWAQVNGWRGETDTAEKMQWVDSAEVFIGARKLRNPLVHEYMSDTLLFVQALSSARGAAEMLFRTVATIEAEATALGLHSKT